MGESVPAICRQAVEWFWDLETSKGQYVRDLRLLGGTHLVWKIPVRDGVIKTPDSYKARSVGNLCAIKGFVIKVSEPWRPKQAVKTGYKWSPDHEMDLPQYKIKTMPEQVSPLTPGDCILYNSYNLGKLEVAGLPEGLVFVRDIDIEAYWAPSYDRHVELGDHAMTARAMR